MSAEEYTLYCYCAEFHSEIRKSLSVNETSTQLARMLSKKLNPHQIQQVIQDIELIKKRGGNVLNYFITIIHPII
ncbi:hypothetical protein [Rossellomorea sp. LjRoot5]|uniref:hypothetical protein n=1 Tax=Rossellomorea sp. LjRoot5 TaxID=3342331 RepID=UPI003ECF9969